ncbi:DUF475 domain-containing protein [Arcobacter cloacae]|uniref:DUF475 domain-containing protein n=1 Tax=Arcobacter cloacae TaxID=1054034 RepID=UPI00155D8968|nr:DUF475 domain-containing protein [Arcobacter cloacae]QKF90351.1 DUF475 domain-containing membrane protein [Arcobacter cloacae]
MNEKIKQKSALSYFNTFFIFFGISLIIEFFYMGILGMVQGTTLTILELALSFDNAVINALILANMSPIWRKRFLTWGMLIAVFGVRLIFPILIVFATTDLSFIESFSLAINNPIEYERIIKDSHHIVMAFGGIFLLMIFLTFLFNENKDVHWIKIIEKYASRWSSVGNLKILIAIFIVAILGYYTPSEIKISNVLTKIDKADIILPMIYGILLFLCIEFFRGILEDDGKKHNTKNFEIEKEKIENISNSKLLKGGFASFIYLELIDMSFSFDGVLGAFAISQNIIIIMLGLGAGAFAVRNLTILMVDRGTVAEYKYLEHGAMWSVGLLATSMIIQIFMHLPHGLIIAFAIIPIAFALIHSIKENNLKGENIIKI